MSAADESPGADCEPTNSAPSAVRVIEIDAEANSFTLDEAALRSVLGAVPAGMKVSIVSVVGAFRTGKSFVLDFFLRYLRRPEEEDASASEGDDAWMGESTLLEGNANAGRDPGSAGFAWRSGRERMTTGIWIWSEHFVRTLPSGEKVAVLLVDTQGMFDSTLGQMLTASIFGLSTLISSYQVYNIDKRIQEDNLQHLALFTEYGRVALAADEGEEEAVGAGEVKDKDDAAADTNWYSSADGEGEMTGEGPRPFQRLEFLVRDWQNFEDEEADLLTLRADMGEYLQEVLAERGQKDLREVREQIHGCFESVSCFLLPHPGFDVTSKSFDGDVKKIRPEFRRLLSDYVRRVFRRRLVAKKVHGRHVSAEELFEFIRAYAQLFKEAKIFPEAKTLLAATAEANNRSAHSSSLRNYRDEMEPLCGSGRPFCAEGKLRQHHDVCREGALSKFDATATIGPRASIRTFRGKLETAIDERLSEYVENNANRDPFKFVTPYIVPLLIALAAYALRIVTDFTCSGWSDVCYQGSNFLSNLYIIIFTFILLVTLATGHGIKQRVGALVGIATGGVGTTE